MVYSTSIGLDVHARSICASALVHETGEVVRSSFGYDAKAVAEWAAGLPQPCHAVRHRRRGRPRAGRVRLGNRLGGPGGRGAGLALVAASRPPAAGIADGPWGDPRSVYARRRRRRRRATLERRQPPAGESECVSQHADVRLAHARHWDHARDGAGDGRAMKKTKGEEGPRPRVAGRLTT